MSSSAISDNDKRVTTQLFHKVKPLCVRLSQLSFQQQVSPNDSLALKNCIQRINETISQSVLEFEHINSRSPQFSASFGDYVFVPVAEIFKQPDLPDMVVTNLLNLLSLLIKYCWSSYGMISEKLAKQLFPLIVFLIGGPPNVKSNNIPSKSTDSREAGTKCLFNLFESLIPQKNFFHDIQTLPALGHCITVLLNSCISTNTDEIEMSISAISTLDLLYFQLINDAEILCHILPGNVSRIANILSMKQSSKPHYKILTKLMALLGSLLGLIFNDAELDLNETQFVSLEDLKLERDTSDLISISETAINSSKKHRTNSWLKATSAQVKIYLNSFMPVLKSHHKIEVKISLMELVIKIFQNCFLCLNSLVPNCVDIVSFIATDPTNQNSQKLKNLCEITHFIDLKNLNNLSKIIRKKLSEYSTLLGSVLNSSDDDKVGSLINSINFNLKILTMLNEERYSDELYSFKSSLLQTLKDELLSIMSRSKDGPNKKVVDNYQSSLVLLSSNYNEEIISQKDSDLYFFKDIYSSSVETSLKKLLNSLTASSGTIRNDTEIIDNFLMNESTNDLISIEAQVRSRSLALWLSTNLLEGSHLKLEKNKTLIDSDLKEDSELSEFLNFEYYNDSGNETDNNFRLIENSCYSVLERSKELLDEISVMDTNKASIDARFVSVYAINSVVNIMKSEFENELIDYLYPVIDSLASHSDQIRSMAQLTTLSIAKYCSNSSVHDLILRNSDYLIDALSLRLTGSSITPQTSAILLVLIKIGKIDLIEKLDDVLNSMFILLDLYHGYSSLCEGFFVVFEEVIEQIKSFYLKNFKTDFHVESKIKPWGMTNRRDLLGLLNKSGRVFEEEKDFDPEKIYFKKNRRPSSNPLQDGEDSVDSDDEDEGSGADSSADAKEEEVWESPIPKSLYLMVQRIYNYGIMLTSHPSLKLKLQVMKTNSKIVPLLASFPKYVYPVLASSWPTILYLCSETDTRIALEAVEMATLMIKYGGSFMDTKFSESWEYLNNHSPTFKSFVQSSTVFSSNYKTQVALPTVNLKIYHSFVMFVMTGLRNSERIVHDSKVYGMIKFCLPLVKDIDRFGSYSDVAWLIRSMNEFKSGSFSEQVPQPVTGRLKTYTFRYSDFE